MTEQTRQRAGAVGTGLPPAAGWLERAVTEMVRGRHLILHGNVRDLARWRGRYMNFNDALSDVLRTFGYSVIGFFDQVDGLVIPGDPAQEHFARLVEGAASATLLTDDPGRAATAQPAAGAARPMAGAGRAQQADDRMTAAIDTAAAPRYQGIGAITAIRRALAQNQEAVAFVMDFADLLLLSPEHHDRSDRQQLGMVKKAMLEAAQVGSLRNLLVLVVSDLAAVPRWLYQNDPGIETVEVPLPSLEQRAGYLRGMVDQFYGVGAADPSATDASVRVLANLTEGLATAALDGLWRTSRFEQIPLAQPRELVNRTMFGQQSDPWRVVRDRAHLASAELGARVLGQPVAVERVSRALAAATYGIDFVADPYSLESRPKGVFFFVGPTGVGKTELAKALSAFVFDDETALLRFDMSSFSEPHNAERFYGAPPGYVGHERGGELTNRMHERPFSVLLFDEIEKAHDSIFDKFLQILEDGRLTDGLGRTAYFSQSVVIFTSNIGADTVYQRIAGGHELTYQEVAAHFEREVRAHFTQHLKRPELLGRIGNGIVPFDILRAEHVAGISRKLLAQLSASCARAGITLDVDEESVNDLVRRAMAAPEARALGGRMVKDVLDRAIRGPLVDALAEGGPHGKFQVTAPAAGDLCVVTRAG